MSQIKIDYSEIASAAKAANTVSKYYDEFADDIEKKVTKKLASLPGTDSKGYISNSKSYASEKIKRLREQKDYYSDLASNIEKLSSNIQDHEKKVVSGVRQIATDALELKNQSKWQAFCQWAYGTFCVDLLNWNPAMRFIGDKIKSGLDWLQEKGTKVIDWFKHGDGKYVLGIVLDTLAVVGAIAGSIIAVALAVAAGPAAVLLIIAAIASVVGTIMTTVDAGFSIANKYKALSESDDPGRARYYGDISGVNDTIKKTDMGGKTANSVWEGIGTGYDLLHTAANITAVVTGTIGAAGLTGKVVTDPVTGKQTLQTTYDPSKIKGNLKNTMLEKIGLRNTNGKWTFSVKNLISTKRKTGTIPRQDVYSKDIVGDLIGDKRLKFLKTIKSYSGKPGKAQKVTSNIEKIVNPATSAYDRFKSTMKTIDKFSFNICSPIKDFNDTVLEIIDSIVELAA